MSKKQLLPFLILLILLTAACATTSPDASPTPPAAAENENNGSNNDLSLSLPDGLQAERLLTDLNRPTQMILGPDGRLWMGQLNGTESAEQGQIIAIDLASNERAVILDSLNKPTGLAILDDYLWVALENSLIRAPLAADGTAGAIEIILEDMPYNGRSNGTLTHSPTNTLIYETSGRRAGNEPAAGSGILWELDPTTLESRPLASGLKGGYAHTFDTNGRLWTTEIGDGRFNGEPPPGELNLVVEGANFGWPQCIGFQVAARNFGGTTDICAQTRPPAATFPPNSTPTSVIPSPFEPDTFLVALWVTGEVWRVPVTFSGDNATAEPAPYITDMLNPQHLLLIDDGSFLLSDYRRGEVYRISAP